VILTPHKPSKVPRKPLRSFKELADELGVTHQVLQGALRAADAPQPLLSKPSGKTRRDTWYDPDQFRAWWRSKYGTTPLNG
jgi:hypothetical protein